MNLLIYLSLCAFYAHFAIASVENSEIQSISRSIQEVSEVFYIRNEIQFDVISIQSDPKHFNQLINYLLASNEVNNSYRLSSITEYLVGLFGIVYSSIILAESCENFTFISTNFQFGNPFAKSSKFLIYIESCDLDLMQNNIEQLIKNKRITFRRGSIEQFEFLLINDGDNLQLASIEWFTESACNQPQLIIINTFNKTAKKWSKKLENYEKFQNFHGCNLTLWIAPDNEESLFESVIVDKNNRISEVIGVIPKVFMDISQKYNFMPKFLNFESDEAEVCFSIFRLCSEFEILLHFTASFMQVHDVILTTPGELYRPFEKLWLPFDDLTWKFLIFVFFVAFLVIFIVNQLPNHVQDRIYGLNIHKPGLNVISAFFGLAQYKVPKKYFARCLLIIFVFFCLIFRTCYQSKLFEFMTSEPRRPPPISVKELRDRNYTMYTTLDLDYVTKLLQDDDNKWPKISQTTNEVMEFLLHTQSQNASAKLSLTIESNSLDYVESRRRKSLKWHQLKNINFQVNQIGFFFFANNFFLPIIDTETQLLTSAGIMNHLVELVFNVKHVFVSKKKWNVLTMDNLKFGFVIWLWSCAATVAAFVCEVLIWIVVMKTKRRFMKYVRCEWNKFVLVYPIRINNFVR